MKVSSSRCTVLCIRECHCGISRQQTQRQTEKAEALVDGWGKEQMSVKEEEIRLPGKSFNPDTEGKEGGQNRMDSNPKGHLEPLDKCGYPGCNRLCLLEGEWHQYGRFGESKGDCS